MVMCVRYGWKEVVMCDEIWIGKGGNAHEIWIERCGNVCEIEVVV